MNLLCCSESPQEPTTKEKYRMRAKQQSIDVTKPAFQTKMLKKNEKKSENWGETDKLAK